MGPVAPPSGTCFLIVLRAGVVILVYMSLAAQFEPRSSATRAFTILMAVNPGGGGSRPCLWFITGEGLNTREPVDTVVGPRVLVGIVVNRHVRDP